ncbi:response regulator [Bordetella trematum]|nr:response regulator [Bordetella trematum]
MKQPAILVIEDHPAQRLVMTRALDVLGYSRIYQAQEGNDALAQLATHGPADIVICDVRTPGMDGTQFLREASRRGQIKSVILSSDVSSDLTAAILHMASLLGIQVLGDLGKPLKLGRLESLLRRYEDDSDPPASASRPPVFSEPSPAKSRSAWSAESSSPITSLSSTSAPCSRPAPKFWRAGRIRSMACCRPPASSRP